MGSSGGRRGPPLSRRLAFVPIEGKEFYRPETGENLGDSWQDGSWEFQQQS